MCVLKCNIKYFVLCNISHYWFNFKENVRVLLTYSSPPHPSSYHTHTHSHNNADTKHSTLRLLHYTYVYCIHTHTHAIQLTAARRRGGSLNVQTKRACEPLQTRARSAKAGDIERAHTNFHAHIASLQTRARARAPHEQHFARTSRAAKRSFAGRPFGGKSVAFRRHRISVRDIHHPTTLASAQSFAVPRVSLSPRLSVLGGTAKLIRHSSGGKPKF